MNKTGNAPGLRSVPVDGGEEITVLESVRLSGWGIADKGIYFLDFSNRGFFSIGPDVR